MEIEIIFGILVGVFSGISFVIRYREVKKSERKLRQKILGLEEETLGLELHGFPAEDSKFPPKRARKPKVERVEVDRLLNTLKTASSDIKKLEEDVRVKGKKVKELTDISETLESLVSLREKQAKAIRQEISSILKENSRSNRIWTIIIGAIWFVLGLVISGFLVF